MRNLILVVALIFAATTSAPVVAQGRGKGQANRPPAGAGAGGPKADRPQPKTPKTAPPATSGGSQRGGKAEKQPKRTPHTAAATTPVVTNVTPTTPVTRAVKNPRLESRLLAMLPAGTNIQDASQGFKNWGQFVAAVHVSNNLDVPFDSLKSAMTQSNPMSLGQALQSLKGDATAPDGEKLSRTKIKNEVKKAEDAAVDDLRRSSGDN